MEIVPWVHLGFPVLVGLSKGASRVTAHQDYYSLFRTLKEN